MKLKQRDINMLIFLGMALLVFCAYFFGFRNLNAMNDEVSAEVAKLEDRYNNLKQMQAKAEGYVEDTENYNTAIQEMYNSFDMGASQEYTIKFLEAIENQTSTWIKSASLSQPEQVFTFGNVKSSNPNSSGEKVYDSNNIGYATKSTISFEASYADFKDVLDNILHNNYKCTLESLSVSYNSADDIVSGSFILTQYAIVDPSVEFDGAYVENEAFGTDNIFMSSVFDSDTVDEENGNDILADYDVYLSLQSYETDSAALKMGFKTDNSKTITNEDNDVKDVTLKITGSDGDYRISYKVGNVTYPVDDYAEGAEFVPGVKLSLLVNSSSRTSVNDVSGANVSIINESDMTLYIKVINDDEGDPRFKINDKQGDVVIYQ